MTSPGAYGVRIAGVGSAVPEKVLTNADLEKMVDTSDEWIVKRTGIRERRMITPETESTYTLTRDALRRALDHAGMQGSDLDQIIVGTVSMEMMCPSVACRVSDELGAAPAGAFDLVAGCSGFVYGINLADSLIRSGRNTAVGVIGCDTMTTLSDFSERSVSILFGDAAGAAVLVRDDDPSVGCIYQSSQADGAMWRSLYIPRHDRDIPEDDRDNPIKLGFLRMNGRDIYRFAVNKFRKVIEEALEATGLSIDQISQFVCHQSNVRIIDAAKDRLGLPDEKVYVNIDRYGNTSAGSVGLCLDELWQAGKIKRGDYVLMVAFGGGLTWATGVWKI
ncbi:MAG: beta-ketoacyl-ACP synthase III [Planctomycetota bacterium]|jgi:3-oxoacyl-[acyl-carrier-protein] synthase-3